MTILSFDLQPTQAKFSNGTAAPPGEHLCKPILKYTYKYRSYGPNKLIYDHFIIWPTSVTLAFNLPKESFKWTTPPREQKLVLNNFEIHA